MESGYPSDGRGDPVRLQLCNSSTSPADFRDTDPVTSTKDRSKWPNELGQR